MHNTRTSKTWAAHIGTVRYPLLILVVAALLIGGWGALARLGWQFPQQTQMNSTVAGVHGQLMIAGVFGTLIALERAVAFAAVVRHGTFAYLAPMLNGIGTLLLMFMSDPSIAQALLIAGSVVAVVVRLIILSRHVATYTGVMCIGTMLLLAANLLWWRGLPTFQTVHIWIAYLVLIIVAERLELSRVRRLPMHAYQVFFVLTGLYILSIIVVPFSFDLGLRGVGVSQMALALWLFHYDIAQCTICTKGLPRFVAACLLSGYVWLFISGTVAFIGGAVYGGFSYDAVLHSVLIGFVFSMIFGHAPIIFPTIIGKAISFHVMLYFPLVVLHAALVLRLMGDFTGSTPIRMWGGLIGGVAIPLFLGMLFWLLTHPVIVRQKGQRHELLHTRSKSV
jgi:hypothetical protein